MIEAPIKIQLDLTPKQKVAWGYLYDDETKEILYGGAAGGGKSYLAVVWLVKNCLKYPGTRWLLGRARLRDLKKSTLNTFFDVTNKWGLYPDEFYKYNSIEGTITFINGSQIVLQDLFLYPSDPEFTSLGSTEYTGAVIEEAADVTQKARNIVSSRLRYKLTEHDLIPKVLITCNPSKNWVYKDFYRPAQSGELQDYQAFVQSLPTDNPHLPESYIESLRNLDPISRERLLYGNWEYDDDPAKLIEYDKILDLFTNTAEKGKRYLSCDVARFGEDKTVIFVWDGLMVTDMHVMDVSGIDEVVAKLGALCERYQIPRSNVVVDEDGVGGGVVDTFKGCKGFVNNSKAISGNYRNLKAECYYVLARMVNDGVVGVQCKSEEVKAALIEELEQVKQKNIDKDGKLEIVGKKEIKEKLGRSPDYADAMMMRMMFEIQPTKKALFIQI